jgi:hypothetical protein
MYLPSNFFSIKFGEFSFKAKKYLSTRYMVVPYPNPFLKYHTIATTNGPRIESVFCS